MNGVLSAKKSVPVDKWMAQLLVRLMIEIPHNLMFENLLNFW